MAHLSTVKVLLFNFSAFRCQLKSYSKPAPFNPELPCSARGQESEWGRAFINWLLTFQHHFANIEQVNRFTETINYNRQIS
jgi:hypothetical protein